MTQSRRKGKEAELVVVHLLHAAGWPDARRSGDAGQIDGDIESGPEGVLLEVRRREALRIPEWATEVEGEAAARARGEIPVLAFRRSRDPWRACLPLTDLLGLLTEVEELREYKKWVVRVDADSSARAPSVPTDPASEQGPGGP